MSNDTGTLNFEVALYVINRLHSLNFMHAIGEVHLWFHLKTEVKGNSKDHVECKFLRVHNGIWDVG